MSERRFCEDCIFFEKSPAEVGRRSKNPTSKKSCKELGAEWSDPTCFCFVPKDTSLPIVRSQEFFEKLISQFVP